jgi:hypothetical protein
MDNTISSLLYNDSDDDHIKNNTDDETAVLPTEKKVTFAKDLENVIDINSTEPTTRLPVIDYPSYKNRGVAVGDDNVGINSSSYFGVENTKLRDEMLFWHINLDHAPKKRLISIVENDIYVNLPPNLTADNINKHLPPCHTCPFGNMRAKPLPIASNTVYAPGECALGDIKHMEVPDIYGNEYLALFVDIIIIIIIISTLQPIKDDNTR